MIKKAITSICFFCLMSCNNESPDNTQTKKHFKDTINTKSNIEDTLKKDTASKSQQQLFRQISNDVIFKATGTEPGWLLLLYKNKYQLIADYGKDTTEEKINISLKKFPAHFQSEKISIYIEQRNCIAVSGDTLRFTVKIKYNNRDLQGCGVLLK